MLVSSAVHVMWLSPALLIMRHHKEEDAGESLAARLAATCSEAIIISVALKGSVSELASLHYSS